MTRSGDERGEKEMYVVGYVYEADVHCIECTKKRFPAINLNEVFDREGNEVKPVFEIDWEFLKQHGYCGDCQCEI